MSQQRLNRHQRPIARRIIVRGTLVLDTPTCLGSGDADSPTDLALLKDSISDRALLTGASIAGALRNYLRECEHGYGVKEQKSDRATTLFGGTRRDPKGEQSPLIIHDAISSAIPAVELRDGVEIDSKTRTAKPQHKYDLELLAAGTAFTLSLELLLEKRKQEEEQVRLIYCLISALLGLEKGEISLGMKKRRGFGRCQVKEWQVWNFNLQNTGDLTAWLNFEHWQTGLLPNYPTYPSIKTAIKETFSKEFAHPPIQLDVSEKDKRSRFCLQAEFTLVGSLLIRSGQDSILCAPDVVHLKSHRPEQSTEPVAVLSGTSLAGVLRHRAERIVNTLQEINPQITQEIVNEIFGFVKDKKASPQPDAKASRLIVHEKVIKNQTDLVQNRIAIDRFTGGAYHGALFSEQPIFGSTQTIVPIELELRNPQEYEIGLLLLLLKDLWTQDLPVGGGSSIGRGRLQGVTATLTRQQPEQKWVISQTNGKLEFAEGDKRTLEDLVSSLVKKTTPNT